MDQGARWGAGGLRLGEWREERGQLSRVADHQVMVLGWGPFYLPEDTW